MASTLIKAAKDKTKRAHNPTNFCTSQDFLHDKLISFKNHFRHLASPSNVTRLGYRWNLVKYPHNSIRLQHVVLDMWMEGTCLRKYFTEFCIHTNNQGMEERFSMRCQPPNSFSWNCRFYNHLQGLDTKLLTWR